MLQQLEISGYRLLDDFTADFGQLTVVIGANATGKSSLMDCLRLISECAEFNLEDALRWHGGLSSIISAHGQTDRLAWRVIFEMPRLKGGNGLVLPEEGRTYAYKVELGKDRHEQPVALYELLSYPEPHEGYKEPFKLLEATQHRSHIFSPDQHGLVPFDEAVAQQDSTLFKEAIKPDAEQSPIPSMDIASGVDMLRLAQMRFFNEYPILSWARALLASFAFYPGFDVGQGSNLRVKPAEIKPHTRLFAGGENLGTVLHEILTRADFRASADELRESMRIAYPFFEDIFPETSFGTPATVLVRMREKGMKRGMELWELSDGTLRFLCLAVALLNPVPPPFVAIDEPEAGLHPKLLPIVADMIKTASERTRVLITTHSPDLVNCFDIDDLAVMAREGPQVVWRRPRTRKTLRQMLENVIGDSLGDLHRTGELESL